MHQSLVCLRSLLRLLFPVLALLHGVILAVLPADAVAQEANPDAAAIEVVRLQHRSAQSIREAIEPLLDSRGSIGQLDNNLIIATTRSNLDQLKPLIEQLDIPRRTLRIAIDFDYVQAQPGAISTQSDSEPLSTLVLEGERAVLSEEDSATTVRLLPDTPAAGLEEITIGAREVHAQAELRGDQVELMLEIHELDETDGSSRSIQTLLTVLPGRWQVLSPDSPEQTPEDSFTLTTENRQMAVRVDVLP